jgi:O-antigen ligase
MLRRSDLAGAEDPGAGMEKRLLRLGARFAVWAGLFGGILLTRSRGAILAAAVTAMVLFALGARHRRARSRRPLRVAAAVAGIVVVGVAAAAGILLRSRDADPLDLGAESRIRLWETSVEAWREFPVLGSGLGAFPEAFRRVQPRELNFLVEHAHCDPLQLLVTGGAAGAALGVALFGSLFVLLLRAWSRQRHREESAFLLAGIGALLFLTLHGLVEFNLSIPVIPATLACVLGAAWAAGRNR